MKSQDNEFKGFSKETIEFFSDLKNNNNRDWFLENKQRYEKTVKEPSLQLVSDMSIRFASTGLPFIADAKKSLFRINRDIRFSANKDPYKTNLGIYFPLNSAHTKVQDPLSIGMYFHLDNSESFIGGGMHMPDSNVLKTIRERISEDWKLLEEILNSKSFESEFSKSLYGEKLKRVPTGYSQDHPAAEFLKLKEYTAWSDLPQSKSYNNGLLDIIEIKAQAILPFLTFLQESFE